MVVRMRALDDAAMRQISRRVRGQLPRGPEAPQNQPHEEELNTLRGKHDQEGLLGVNHGEQGNLRPEDDPCEPDQDSAPRLEPGIDLTPLKGARQPLYDVDAAHRDWFPCQVTLYVLGKELSRPIAMSRVLFEALEADRLQVPVNLRIEQSQRCRIVLNRLE